MGWFSLRNNWFKFKTLSESRIVLKESIENALDQWRKPKDINK